MMTDISREAERNRDNLKRKKNHFKTHNNKIEKFKNLEGKQISKFSNKNEDKKYNSAKI